MRMRRNIPGRFSSMCWLVRVISSAGLLSIILLPCKICSFIRTGQQDVLSNANLPSIVSDIRNICALQSTLLGNVTDTNSNPPPTSSGSLTREVGLLIGTMISILGIVFANGWFGFWSLTMDLYEVYSDDHTTIHVALRQSHDHFNDNYDLFPLQKALAWCRFKGLQIYIKLFVTTDRYLTPTTKSLQPNHSAWSPHPFSYSYPSLAYAIPFMMAAPDSDSLVTQIMPQRVPRARAPPRAPPPPPLTNFSTVGVADSAWSSLDFMLGAGMVIIQENTHKIVVVFETQKKYWFFPRGRKDIGESLEKAALREAYEEVGILYLPSKMCSDWIIPCALDSLVIASSFYPSWIPQDNPRPQTLQTNPLTWTRNRFTWPYRPRSPEEQELVSGEMRVENISPLGT